MGLMKRSLCIEPLIGTDITKAAADAVEIAYMESRNIILRFNGIFIDVTGLQDPKTIVDEYHARLVTEK